MNKAGTCSNGWAALDNGAGFYTANAQTTAQVSNWAEWYPNITKSGTYRIEAFIGNHTTNFCGTSVPGGDTSNAQYRVYHNNTAVTVNVNQLPLVNQWVKLGDFQCIAGTACHVRLTDHTGEPYLSRTVSFGDMRFTLLETPPTYAIRGKVATSSGTGVSGVTVSTGGKSAQTDTNGNYAITGLGAGAYTVTPSKSGYTFSPGSRNVTLGPDASNVNFTATIIQQGEARIFVHPASSSVSLTAGTHCIKVNAETVQSLTGFEFKLRFPPSLLEGQSVKEGPFLGSTGNSTFPLSKIDNAEGTISFGSTIVGSGTGPTGTGEIADICFSPKKEGSASLTFDSGQLLGPNGDDIPATLSGGTIEITSCYWADLNCDGKVTIVDVQKVASHWGTQQGDPLYDPAYDLDNNGTINIADVQKIASQWGWPNREAARPAQPSASIALSLDPESLDLTVGETKQLALKVDGAQNLAAFEAKLHYNPAHLQVNEVVIADFLSSTGRTVIPLGPDIDNSAGTAYFGAASVGDQVGVDGSGVLALVSVTALAPGSGAIDLFDSHATAPDATPFDIDSESDASYAIPVESEEFFLFLPAVIAD